MTADRAALRNAASYGGITAALMHALVQPGDDLQPASIAFLALMYLSLPAFIWSRSRWGLSWPALVFAGSFGYCVVDAMLGILT